MSRQGNRPGANAFTEGQLGDDNDSVTVPQHTHTHHRVFVLLAISSVSRWSRSRCGSLCTVAMGKVIHITARLWRTGIVCWDVCVCVKVRFRDERQVSGRLAGWGVFYHLSTQTFATPLLDSSCAFVLSLTGTDFKWILISIRCYRTIYCGVCSSVLWFHRHNGLQLNMARSVDSVFRIRVQLRYHSDMKLTKENIW